MTPLRISYRNTAQLTPNPRNARRHSEKQIDQIAASIAEFGFNAPILVDAQFTVLAGHGRLAAARKLQLESVPTVSIEHLSEAQRRAFMLADTIAISRAGSQMLLIANGRQDEKSYPAQN